MVTPVTRCRIHRGWRQKTYFVVVPQSVHGQAGQPREVADCHQFVVVHTITIDLRVTRESTICGGQFADVGAAGRVRSALAGDGSDRGALSLMLVILFVVLVALAGIVVDGGAKLDADEQAYALAQEAARAGATTVDASSAYGTGAFVVDPQRALAAARSYLAAARQDDYQVRAVGQRKIWVSVTISEPTTFLSMIGISHFTCTGTATASLVTGVTGGT